MEQEELVEFRQKEEGEIAGKRTGGERREGEKRGRGRVGGWQENEVRPLHL